MNKFHVMYLTLLLQHAYIYTRGCVSVNTMRIMRMDSSGCVLGCCVNNMLLKNGNC